MTPIDLITRALRTAGVYGQSEIVRPEDLSDSFAVLNEMLDSWSTARLFVYQLQADSLTATPAKAVYTMGAGGDFNVTRPTQVSDVVYTTGGVDYTLIPFDRKNFNDIAVKTVSGIPEVFDYEPSYPLGNLYLWPVPASAGTLKVDSPQQLTQFATPTTDVKFPPGYQEAIRLSLAIALAQEFRVPVPNELSIRTGRALRRIRRLNFTAPTLDGRPTQSDRYDINSDLI